MSKATKRKYVTQEVMEEYFLPEGTKEIMRVVASKGNNLHEVETSAGDRFLASMPTKFRKNVWIKRGDYVITEPIEEGNKVKAEIVHILYPKQIKYIQEQELWPVGFASADKGNTDQMIPDDMLPPSESDNDSDEDERQEQLISNPNRRYVEESSDSCTSSEEEEEEENLTQENSNGERSSDISKSKDEGKPS